MLGIRILTEERLERIKFLANTIGWKNGYWEGRREKVEVDRIRKLVPNTEAKRVEKIIINRKVMVVIWDDHSKTKSTCSPDDTFDPMIGFAMCLAKKTYGKKKLIRMLKKAQIQGEKK